MIPKGWNGLSVRDAQAACSFNCFASKCARRRIFIGFPDKFAKPAFYAGLVSLDFTGDNRRGALQRSNQCGDCYSTQKSMHNSGINSNGSGARDTTRRCEVWRPNGFASCSVAGKIGLLRTRANLAALAKTKLTARYGRWCNNPVKSLWIPCEKVRERE